VALQEYPFVLGTAGHIDHGKTTLVKALSGVDCDRLAEEKKRGMTIELGFAPLTLPSGKTISVVDVPGHEKFIRQMVAGAAGIDAVMLVVAADDGVMPQTREHLEILTLLGIKNGLTVINKTDLVDEDTLEMAKDDIRGLLAGTFLEKAPLLPVSAVTGAGLDELRQAISELVEHGEHRDRSGAFFLPVDRAFHISGFGTVVTGTAARGFVSEGDDLEVLPGGQRTKVRSIQVHSESVATASAGQRTAVNLANVTLEEIKRGDVVAAAGRYAATECFDAEVSVLKSFSQPLVHWERLRLHIGTSDILVRISMLDRDKIIPGDTATVQLLPEEPICTMKDAHFILRTYSPLRTIAGGRVLLPLGMRPKSKHAKTALLDFLANIKNKLPAKEYLQELLDYKGMLPLSDALMVSCLEPREFQSAVDSLEAKKSLGVIKAGETTLVSVKKAAEIKERFLPALVKFHMEHPERKGMDMEEASRCLETTDIRFARELLKLFAAAGWLKVEEDRVKTNDFEPFDEAKFAAEVASLKEYAAKLGYSLPTVEEASAALGFGARTMDRVLAYLRERKEASIIGGGFILLSVLEEDFWRKLASLSGDITLAGVRDITNSSRKYVLPLLEYFDSKGVTRRVGDKRILLRKPSV